ncbi:MAG: lactate racemase domain-containing protein [Candidatus Kariarchaeaceae archaeon]
MTKPNFSTLNLKNDLIENLPLDELIYEETDLSKEMNDEQLKEKLKGLPELLKDCLIVVNDNYRSTPTSRIIRLLRELGKLTKPAKFIIATGTHKPPTKELALKLSGAAEEDQLFIHDVYSLKEYYAAGTTSRGTEVLINPIIKDAVQILTINSVEPHYFAGFTGGPKSLVPGIAAKSTIETNHRWAITPESKVMKTKGNPVFEDIWEAASLVHPLDKIITVQLVNNGEKIVNAFIGNLTTAFDKAKLVSRKLFGVAFPQKVDRLITIVDPPLDKNLYQSQKALENTKNVVNDGGTLVLVSKCEEGVGTKAFFDKIIALGTAEEVITKLSFETYQFGDHKAFYWAELATRLELLFLGDPSEQMVKTAFMTKITQKELIELVANWLKKGDSVALDTAGGISAFYLSED